MVDRGTNAGLPDNVFMTRLDAAANWARSNSLWPMPFATACCGIELMATASSRFDLARFGAEVMRFSPRQCDLMIVAGRVVMNFVIGLPGNVKSVRVASSDLKNAKVGECIKKEIGKITFKAPDGGECVVQWPFKFTAQ